MCKSKLDRFPKDQVENLKDIFDVQPPSCFVSFAGLRMDSRWISRFSISEVNKNTCDNTAIMLNMFSKHRITAFEHDTQPKIPC